MNIPASDFLVILPFLVIAGWACILLLVDLFIPKDRKGVTAVLSAIGLIAGLGIVLFQFGQAEVAFGGMIVADGFASFMQAIFFISGIMGILLAYDYLRRNGIERGEYYTLMLFSISGMALMALAGDLIVVFVAIELLSLPLYVLSGFARPRMESEESAMKYFLLGAFASGFLVYGIALVFGATETTRMGAIVSAVAGGPPDQLLLFAGVAMILVGLGFKVAAVPFHMWTPDVYHGAPSSLVGFMSVAVKAGGFAALLRVFVAAFPELADLWGPIAMWIAALTMTWGNIAAIAQSNIKRMLAYSSIAHAGYILMALPAAAKGWIAPEAVSAALFYLIAYVFSNVGAWAVVLCVEREGGKGLDIEDYAGLAKRKPGLALAMTLFMLSLTGLPPTAGFIGKFFIFRAAIEADLIWLALVGVITSLISAYYYLRVVVVMYMREGEPETVVERWVSATVFITASLTLIFGLLPGYLLQVAESARLFAYLP